MSQNQSIIQQLYTSTVNDLLEPLDSKESTIEKSADVKHVFQMLGTKKHLWVVDSQTTMLLVGVITESNTIQLFAPALDSLQSFDIPTLQSFQFGLTMTAQEVMSVQPVSTEPEETIAEVISKMKQHKIKQLPVLDKNNRIVGEITLSHLIEVYLEKLRSDPQMTQETAAIEKNLLESS